MAVAAGRVYELHTAANEREKVIIFFLLLKQKASWLGPTKGERRTVQRMNGHTIP